MWSSAGRENGFDPAGGRGYNPGTMAATNQSLENLGKSRGWLITGGILSVLVGLLAMTFPLLFSIVIAQLLGAFALVSGVISLGMALFGKHVAHRVFSGLSGLVRIVAGIFLLVEAGMGVTVIALILSVFLTVEGVFFIANGLQMWGHRGAGWIVVNGVAALVLGLMIFYHWPGDSGQILGLLYGINSLFSGASLLALGLSAPKPAA